MKIEVGRYEMDLDFDPRMRDNASKNNGSNY